MDSDNILIGFVTFIVAIAMVTVAYLNEKKTISNVATTKLNIVSSENLDTCTAHKIEKTPHYFLECK